MAEAILKFDLNDSDDTRAHLRAIKALDMALALWDMDGYLRTKIKYGELDDKTYNALQETRDELRGIMQKHSVDLDELIN
jgi:hypothetical protein